jgi:hypothetical protein
MQFEGKKIFIWLLAILVVSGILLAVALRPTGGANWEATKKRIAQLETDTRSRKFPRSALRGKLSPGNAWDEYNLALKDPVPWNDDPNGGLLGRFVSGGAGVDRAKVERLIAEHKQAIEHLRLGTKRSDGQYPYNWHRGSQMDLPSLMGLRRLANLAAAQAKVWAESGKPQDAADLLLDVSIFARDISTNAPLLSNLIGLAVYSVSFDGLRDLIQSGKLTPTQLADLAAKLEAVDHDFPTAASAFSNDALLSSLSLLEAAEGGPSPFFEGWRERLKEGGVRFVMYPRTMAMEAVEERHAYVERFEKLNQKDFAAAKKEADAISAEVESSNNVLVRLTTPAASKVIIAHHKTLAGLRLIRAGAVFLATGDMPALADPFGDKLFHKQDGGKPKIWSIGSDGTNQNGIGNWEGQPDMVLEISK